jgi:hypothetical protein
MAERRTKNTKKRSAFVPSVVFTTAVAGVVPACVLACGSGGSTTQNLPSVACVGYSCGVAAVAYMGFDSGRDSTADAPADAPGDAPGDATQDARDANGFPFDGPLGVAADAFGGG